MKFEKLNVNPKGLKTGDCVVRAISYATNKEWDEVYRDLCVLGVSMKRMPNEKQVYEKYLEKCGWVKHKQPKNICNTKYTVKDFLDEYMPAGTIFIISVANHLTCARYDGMEEYSLIDTWDCSFKCVGNYWTKGE